MAKKRQKLEDKRTIRCTDTFEYYFLDGDLKSVAEKIQKWREKYGDEAQLLIDYCHGYYDDLQVKIEIHYERLETDKEVQARVEKARRLRKAKADEKKRRQENERKDLERLVKRHPELTKAILGNQATDVKTE